VGILGRVVVGVIEHRWLKQELHYYISSVLFLHNIANLHSSGLCQSLLILGHLTKLPHSLHVVNNKHFLDYRSKVKRLNDNTEIRMGPTAERTQLLWLHICSFAPTIDI